MGYRSKIMRYLFFTFNTKYYLCTKLKHIEYGE